MRAKAHAEAERALEGWEESVLDALARAKAEGTTLPPTRTQTGVDISADWEKYLPWRQPRSIVDVHPDLCRFLLDREAKEEEEKEQRRLRASEAHEAACRYILELQSELDFLELEEQMEMEDAGYVVDE